MTEFRKLIAALLGGVATSVASGGDWRVILASAATAVAVWAVPNSPAKG